MTSTSKMHFFTSWENGSVVTFGIPARIQEQPSLSAKVASGYSKPAFQLLHCGGPTTDAFKMILQTNLSSEDLKVSHRKPSPSLLLMLVEMSQNPGWT
jgi:hypothetical protein